MYQLKVMGAYIDVSRATFTELYKAATIDIDNLEKTGMLVEGAAVIMRENKRKALLRIREMVVQIVDGGQQTRGVKLACEDPETEYIISEHPKLWPKIQLYFKDELTDSVISYVSICIGSLCDCCLFVFASRMIMTFSMYLL
jgi:hypothetical protein